MLKTAAYDYSCVMVNLPDDTLNAIQSRIDPSDLYTAEPEYGLETEPHVTILYGLHTNDLVDVRKVVEKTDINFVRVKLTTLSLFENDRYDVLKYNVESEDLTALNKAVKKLPFTSSYPNYNPHCTVAYLKKGTGKKYLNEKPLNKTFKSILWTFSPSKGLKTKQPFNSQFVITRLRRKMKQGMEKEANFGSILSKLVGGISRAPVKLPTAPAAAITATPTAVTQAISKVPSDLIQTKFFNPSHASPPAIPGAASSGGGIDIAAMLRNTKAYKGGEATAFVPTAGSTSTDVIKRMHGNPGSDAVGVDAFYKPFNNSAKVPSLNILRYSDKSMAESMKYRNLVPQMPQMSNMGIIGGKQYIKQPFVAGPDASWKAIRDWTRRNNVTPLRDTTRYMGRRTKSIAGITEYNSPLLGFIPRKKMLFMDDIKPANFKMNAQGQAVPIDVLARPVNMLRAAYEIPQIRGQILRRIALRLGVTGATGAGAVGIGSAFTQ